MKDTKQPDQAMPDAGDSRGRTALHETGHGQRDANAVFNVLDALEPPAGKQRLLRGGVAILAGAFFLLAMGLLVSRYAEGIRPQSKATIPQASAEGAGEKGFDPLKPEDGKDAKLDASGAAPEADALQLSGSPGKVPLSAQTLAPANDAVDFAAAPLAQAGNPRQEMTRQVSRYMASDADKPRAMPGAKERNHRTGRPARRAKQMLAKGKTALPSNGRRKDADVELIAALLARAPQKPVHARGSGKALQPNPNAAAPEPHAGLGGPASNSDVVIRTPTETTASLVKRCGTLGLVEGQLCRARICSGLWGQDAACPAATTASMH